MINIKSGNIINAAEDIICHQVNCLGIMGGGLALQIKNKYPEVFKAYKEFCPRQKTEQMLGQTQIVACHDGKYIANIFGQNECGWGKQQTDYDALAQGFNRLFSAVTNDSKYSDKSIAIPYGIGCGLGGGDWNEVLKIIEKSIKAYDVKNVVIYKL